MLREESNTTPRLRTFDEGILVVSPTVMQKSCSVGNFCDKIIGAEQWNVLSKRHCINSAYLAVSDFDQTSATLDNVYRGFQPALDMFKRSKRIGILFV